jgi:hypothetical protein
LRLVGDERWRLHLSTALLLEYEAVSVREAQNFWLQPDLIEDVLDYLCANAQEHAISFRWRPFLPDPNDDFILELSPPEPDILLRITCAISRALKPSGWTQ